MNAIGETLRRERLRQGLDLQSLSHTTKIGTRLLQAIEAGDFEKLPGGVFTRNFIKQYAAALGVDPASFDSELEHLRPKTDENSHRDPSSFLPNEASSSGSVVSAGARLLLVALACGVIYYFLRPQEDPKPAPAAVPAVRPTEQRQSDPLSAPVPEQPETPSPSTVTPTPPEGTLPVQVVLSATEPSWVSISVDGKFSYSGILQANDRREIGAEEKVKVIAGNAGGLGILLNGKEIEPIGPRGQPRTVELTKAGAQVVSRAPKAEPLF